MTSNDRSSESRPSPFAALRHPLFWVALVALLLNDHVLKGAGLLPDAVTGKLSDFAGLIVAPLLFTALLGGRRGLAFTAVGSWFVAVNLVPEAARMSEAAMAQIGVSWQLWADPTDLVALCAMPVAWHMTAWVVPTSRNRRPLELAAVMLAGFACIATSNPPPPEPGPPIPAPPPQNRLSIQNNSGQQVDLRVRWVEGEMDCDAIEQNLAEALGRDTFGPGLTFNMGVGSFASLDQEGSETAACQAALIQSSAFDERIFFWRPANLIPGQTIVTLAGLGELNEPSGSVRSVEPMEAAPTEPCFEREVSQPFGWSSLGPDYRIDGTLESLEPTIDDCVEMTLRDGFDELQTVFVCIPEAALRFNVGDELSLDASPLGGGQILRIVAAETRSDGEPQQAGRVVVYRGVTPELLDGSAGIYASPSEDACTGDRLACGGYRVARGLTLHTNRDGVPLYPGDSFLLALDAFERVEVYLGRAETMLFARTECGEGRDSVGTRIDAALTYWEESE